MLACWWVTSWGNIIIQSKALVPQIVVDNDTSPAYTMLTLRCEDRKGLLYDIFRTMKDIDLRWGGGVGACCACL